MLPISAINNASNRISGNAIGTRQIIGRYTIRTAKPNFSDLLICKPGVSVPLSLSKFRASTGDVVIPRRIAPVRKSVLRVLLRSAIFQIICPIIVLVSVLVVNLGRVLGHRPNECFCDECVYPELSRPAVFRERDKRISIVNIGRREHASDSMPIVRVNCDSLNSAQVRYQIKAFIADNRTPYFAGEFRGGKFRFSQGVNLQSGLALDRLVRETPSHARAVCILA